MKTITIEISGPIDCGKSLIAIEILKHLTSLGLTVDTKYPISTGKDKSDIPKNTSIQLIEKNTSIF